MGGAVGVPERERGVIGERAVVHLAIGATVVAIDIGEDRGRRHGVVEGGVEDASLREVGGLDGDPGQRLVPRLVGEGHLVAEVPSGQLGLAVGLGVVDADGRQSDLHQERLRHIGGGDEPSAAVHRLNSDGLRELGGEEHLLIVGPSLGETVAGERGGGDALHPVVGGLVPPDALCEIEQEHGAVGVGAEGVTVEAGALRGGELHPHVGLLELHGVVAGAHGLVGVVEEGTALLGAGHGQEGDVAEVADARAAEVLVAEADEDGVGGVVAGAPVPASCGLGGSELHVAEGHVGTEDHVAVAASADAWVDVLGEGGWLRLGGPG